MNQNLFSVKNFKKSTIIPFKYNSLALKMEFDQVKKEILLNEYHISKWIIFLISNIVRKISNANHKLLQSLVLNKIKEYNHKDSSNSLYLSKKIEILFKEYSLFMNITKLRIPNRLLDAYFISNGKIEVFFKKTNSLQQTDGKGQDDNKKDLYKLFWIRLLKFIQSSKKIDNII